MTYRDELTLAMDNLAADKATRFIGYGVKIGGRALGTLKNVPDAQLIETPVAENLMVGLATGLSGQFLNFNPDDYRDLIARLILKGHRVLSTAPTGLCPHFENRNVTFIGAASIKAKAIVGTSTGPSWPCLNVHNQAKPIILCADVEQVILTPRTRMAKSVYHAIHLLEGDGIL